MRLRAERGVVMNHKKIARIKSDYGLVTRVRRRNPYKAIMKKTREHRAFANILGRQFRQERPGTVLCTDITYLPFGGRMAYLSAVKDVASREIVGWSLGRNLQMDLVFRTLDDLGRNAPGARALLHSDQGVHYTSPEFAARARALDLVQSMSRKGNCVDNAPMESFFGHFKDEVDYGSCRTFEEVERLTATYMDYYNNGRSQWKLNKMPPARYREHLLLKGG
jgi:transposase InsO family protein